MSQDNIFREVDEELRSDRVRALWRRFGPYIIAVAILAVLVVAVNEGVTWWQRSNSARSSDAYYAALELEKKGDNDAARAALDPIIATGGGYATLARFKQASLLAKAGKSAEAVAAYDTIATTEGDPAMRNLALLLAGNILVDTGSLSDVKSRVDGLNDPNNPLHNSAREAIGLAQYKAGDIDAARATFQSIIDDPTAGADMTGRVQLFLDQLSSETKVADTGVVPGGVSNWLPAGAGAVSGSATAPSGG